MLNKIYNTDALTGLRLLPNNSVDCIVTSPPYWQMRDYEISDIRWSDGWTGQLGLEPTRDEFIAHLLLIFDECKRVLKPSGTLWVNLGDSYSKPYKYNIRQDPKWHKGTKNNHCLSDIKVDKSRHCIPSKSLCNIPNKFADEMILRGWHLRNEIIWHKPSCIPSSATDRFTIDFEKIFFFTKSSTYLFDQQFEPYAKATLGRYKYPMNSNGKCSYYQTVSGSPKGVMKTNPKGRNMRCVWRIAAEYSNEAHFAMYPKKLVETPILAGSPDGGTVLDPFSGGGTTAVVAKQLGRNYIGFEPNPDYVAISQKRLDGITSALN